MNQKILRALCLALCAALLVSSLPITRAEAAEAAAQQPPSSETSDPEETTEPVQEKSEGPEAVPQKDPSEEVTEGTTEPTTEEPTELTEAATVPTEETTVPTEETTAPTEETTAPTEGTTAPTEETTVPTEESVPIEESEPESDTMTAEASAEMGTFAAQSETTGIETISIGEEKSYELRWGDISLSFTPSESGTYAFITGTGSVFSTCRLSVYEGDTCLAQLEWSTDEWYNRWCCFNAEAGKEYILRFNWDAFYANVCVAKAEAPTGIRISDESRFGSVGDQFHLSAQFLPVGAVPESLSWSSSNPSVASVDQDGNVTILANGSANIIVQNTSGLSASCSVSAQSPTFFSFDCHEMTRYLDAYNPRLDIGYSFEPYGTSEEIIQWDVSDPSVAEIIKDTSYPDHPFWELKCYKTGETTITATTQSGLTDTCVLTVKNKEPIEYGVPKTVMVHAGDTVRLSFIYTVEENTDYAFYSENGDGYLSIGGGPLFGPGKDILPASSFRPNEELAVWNRSEEDQTYTVCIRKAVPVESISIFQEKSGEKVSKLTGKVGDNIGLTSETFPKWSLWEVGTWTSSDESVVSIDAYGDVTLNKAGSAVITVTTESGAQASCTVTVEEMETIQPGESRTITLTPREKVRYSFTPQTTGKYVFHMPHGEFHPEEQFSEDFAFSIYKDGEYVGELVSNDLGYGLYCTMEKGVEYTLTASYPDGGDFGRITGTVYLDVLQEAESFSLESYDTLYPGCSFNVQVNDILPENAYIIETTWTVSDPNVVSISNSSDIWAGCVVVGEGTATITATAGNGVSASYEVEISPAEDWGELGSKTVSLEGGETKCFRFIPQTSGKYVLTVPHADTDGRILDVDVMKNGERVGESISNSDSSGVYIEMEKGTEYLLMVENYNDNKLTGTISLGTYIEPEALTISLCEVADNFAYLSDILHVGGESYAFVDAYPENTYAVGITWASSDPSVLTIGKNEYGALSISTLKAGTVTITATAPNGAVGTKEVAVKEGKLLPVLEGANSTVTVSNSLTVRIDGEMEKLDEVRVDGEIVAPENYTVTKGSTVVTLRPEYMKTLKTGYHWLNVYFSDGWAATAFEITSAVLGDVNGDGKVTSLDAAMVYAAVNNKKVLTDGEFKAADVDGNGKIQAKDASMVYAHVNNRLEKFPAEK